MPVKQIMNISNKTELMDIFHIQKFKENYLEISKDGSMTKTGMSILIMKERYILSSSIPEVQRNEEDEGHPSWNQQKKVILRAKYTKRKQVMERISFSKSQDDGSIIVKNKIRNS
jgi:hypothetical protein